MTRASVFSLALRITRICSKEEEADHRFQELATRLREREYSEAVISSGITRAKAVPREEALKKVVKKVEEGSRQHFLIVEWDRRSSPPLADILDTNFKEMVSMDQRLGRVFKKVPRPAFKGGKNIKELLCRAKLPSFRRVAIRGATEEARLGLTRCNKGLARRGCVGCPFMTSRQSQHGAKDNNRGENNLQEGGFLYLLWSTKAPAMQYLGSSEQEPVRRLGGHKGDIENRRLKKARVQWRT